MQHEKFLPKAPVLLEGSSAYAESITLESIAHLSEAMRHVCSDPGAGHVCLDIGANIGFTALFMDQMLDGAEIWCFEPHPKTFSQLVTNIDGNATGANRFALKAMALGQKKDELPFRDIDTYNTGNSLLKPGSLASHQNSITVPVERLDSLEIVPDRTISLIKIDVEGFEIDVLRGAEAT